MLLVCRFNQFYTLFPHKDKTEHPKRQTLKMNLIHFAGEIVSFFEYNKGKFKFYSEKE